MAKKREWNLQKQSSQIQRQIQGGQSPQAAVSDTLGGGRGTANQYGNDATTLGTGGADVHAGGGTAAGVAAVAGTEGAGEAGQTGDTNSTQTRAGGVTAIGAAGGDTLQAGPTEGRASGSAMAERLMHRARGFATEVSEALFRGIKKR
jgi:hypothetical protein